MITKVWSSSKKKAVEVSELADGHIHNVLAKVQRGDYEDEFGQRLDPDNEMALEAALNDEIGRRKENEVGPPHEDADVPPEMEDDSVAGM